MNYFCNRLKEERKRLKLNQEEFANLGGVKKGAQFNYENGSRVPDVSYLFAIATAGVDLVFLMTGHPSPDFMSDDENELLIGYRALDVRGKTGVLALINGMREKENAPRAVFHGNVGQVVQGDQTTKGVTFTVESSHKKEP